MHFWERIKLQRRSSRSCDTLNIVYCSISMRTLILSCFTKARYSRSLKTNLRASKANTSGSSLSLITSKRNSAKSCTYERAPEEYGTLLMLFARYCRYSLSSEYRLVPYMRQCMISSFVPPRC